MRVRRAGKVPAVMYGHGETPVHLAIEDKDVRRMISHATRVVEIQGEGINQPALVKEVQYDSMGDFVIHMDFMRISMDERVTVTVPIHLVGTPEGLAAGGVLDHVMHEIAVEAAVMSIPDEIKVKVAKMAIGDQVFVRDLTFPEGVVPQVSPEHLVVAIRQQIAEEEAAPAEGAEAGATEPEVIGRKKEDEDAEGEEAEKPAKEEKKEKKEK